MLSPLSEVGPFYGMIYCISKWRSVKITNLSFSANSELKFFVKYLNFNMKLPFHVFLFPCVSFQLLGKAFQPKKKLRNCWIMKSSFWKYQNNKKKQTMTHLFNFNTFLFTTTSFLLLRNFFIGKLSFKVEELWKKSPVFLLGLCPILN